MNRRVLCAAASAFAVLLFDLFFLLRPVLRLPDISALDQVIAGESVVPIRTVSGQLIYEYNSPTYGEQIPVTLDEISDELVALTLVTEDSRFFTNPGFSPFSILRALIQNLTMRETFSGASTITQQVVRNILLSEKERFTRSIGRKAKEIVLSVLVTMRYSKETILTLYLNEIYYGQMATGVEKAAEVYFGKHASEVGLSEAAFIAGLPQAPNYYGSDPEQGIKRQQFVLSMLEWAVHETPCIQVRSGKDPRSYCPSLEEIRESMINPEETD